MSFFLGTLLGIGLGLGIASVIYSIMSFYGLHPHKCPPCQNECCVNPKKVDPSSGCQTPPDEDPPMHTCCGHGPYKD